jgi:hypothetical protein
LTKQVLNEAFGNLSFGKTSELEKISWRVIIKTY